VLEVSYSKIEKGMEACCARVSLEVVGWLSCVTYLLQALRDEETTCSWSWSQLAIPLYASMAPTSSYYEYMEVFCVIARHVGGLANLWIDGGRQVYFAMNDRRNHLGHLYSPAACICWHVLQTLACVGWRNGGGVPAQYAEEWSQRT